MNEKEKDILEMMEKNSKIKIEEISKMTRIPENNVLSIIKNFEEYGIIRQYRTIIDWEKVEGSFVYAIVQIKVSLEKGSGYEKVAEKISKYSNV